MTVDMNDQAQFAPSRPGCPEPGKDWWQCEWCSAVRAVSGRWRGRQLRCKQCGQLRNHRVLLVDQLRWPIRWHIERLIEAGVAVGFDPDPGLDRNGKPVLCRLTASMTAEDRWYLTPEEVGDFRASIHLDATPWGLARALRDIARELTEPESWSSAEWKYGDSMSRVWAARATEIGPLPGSTEFRKDVCGV